MSLQAIADAATAQNALHDRINDFIDTLEADKAAYAALAANLIDLVEQQLDFSATWNPDEVAPDNVAGGTFSDLQLLLATAPPGATLTVTITPGQTVHIDQEIVINRQEITFKGQANNRPVIVFDSYVTAGGLNAHRQMKCATGSFLVRFDNVDSYLPAKADPAAGWDQLNSMITGGFGGPAFSVAFVNSAVTAADEGRIVRMPLGGLVFFTSRLLQVTGTVELVKGTNYGVLILANYVLSLSGGAVVHGEGTLGVNVLER